MNNNIDIHVNEDDSLRVLKEADENAKRKAEERERLRKKRNGRKTIGDSWDLTQKDLSVHCEHCGLHISKSIVRGLNYFYCKRCKELQTATTKEVLETVVEREYRGFWQWLWHKPATIKRTVYSEIVDCKPQCYICKRDDMIVPFDGLHCPVCGQVLTIGHLHSDNSST